MGDTESGDELLARVRAILAGPALAEQRMFGGVCFLIDGNMLAGVSKERGLLLRLGKEGFDEALRKPGTRVMEMRGKPLAGYLYVDPAVLDDAALADWLGRAAAFVRTLPPKDKSSKDKAPKDMAKPKRGAAARAPTSGG